jgi:hypothetical protein
MGHLGTPTRELDFKSFHTNGFQPPRLELLRKYSTIYQKAAAWDGWLVRPCTALASQQCHPSGQASPHRGPPTRKNGSLLTKMALGRLRQSCKHAPLAGLSTKGVGATL